jgi:flagellar protein FlgJ
LIKPSIHSTLLKNANDSTKKEIIAEKKPLFSTKKMHDIHETKLTFHSAKEFIQTIYPLAQKVAKKIGVDPKILLSQAALETGWGKHIIHHANGRPSFNLFGIKASHDWKGNSVNVETLEVKSGVFVPERAHFRSYRNFEASLNDFIHFIQEHPRYQSTLQSVDNAKTFIESLQSAGYATDPDYAKKIMRIFKQLSSQKTFSLK